ncbi:terminal nucleotidyltransferase 4B isoform X2 [Punica granatum]|uniref:polynucleotide adenylyltransferase n=1 Tax=Punica granatum TaxID=22663 RepID=A0A6P8EHS8_PUNGR|nr:terminal nucleotidyltransferase 4B isoform X2 [Punica granatum]
MEASTATPRSCLYETLSPLPLSFSPDSGQSPQPPESPGLYSVFRNEISLSDLHPSSPGAAVAPDFFSLDVEAEPESVEEPASPRSAWEAELKTPAREAELPRLEGSWFRGNSRFKSPMLQLHKEIVDFCDFLSPTPEEQALRNSAVESVFEVIKYIWPNCRVEVFGSFCTGLYLPTSDIDVVIIGSGIKTPQLGLQALSKALSQKGIAIKIQVIAKARVPIIKFVEKKSKVAFDISFDAQNGPVAADYIKVYSGGIGSYALLTMIMALLRNVRASQASPEHNLGVLLVNFFDFYGRKLNTADVGISCRGGGAFYLKSSRGFSSSNFRGWPLISIEDPQAPDNDIGKNSFNYSQIRSAFAMAFSTLTNPKTIMSLGPQRSILGTIIRPDPVLLGRKGGRNGEVTFKSLLPGAGEPVELGLESGQDMFCNWQWDNEEEPLPRGGNLFEPYTELNSSGKRKRKSSTSKKSDKKERVDEDAKVRKRQEESGTKDKTPKNNRKKQKNQPNGSIRYLRAGSL